jgi:hypothetical protein
VDAPRKPAEPVAASKVAAALPAPAPSAPAEPAPKAAPVVRAAMVRKGTMQQVDEGFESMLESASPPPAPPPPVIVVEPVPVPVIVAQPPPPPVVAQPPPVSATVARVEAPVASPAPLAALEGGLLAQKVVILVGPGGELRIVAAEGLASLPEGAIAAIVVPLVMRDGESLARLLRRG